jgi:hypothetical protein
MKTTYKVIAAIFALGLVILLGLHLFLQYGLTKAMREVVLPRIRQSTGIDVQVDRLSINLPNGRLCLKGAAIRNPEGFAPQDLASVRNIKVEVDIPSLLKRPLIRVRHVTIEDARVNVVRNEAGEFNIRRLQEGRPQPAAPTGRPPGPSTGIPREAPESSAGQPEAGPPKPLPEVLIETLACQAEIRYVDRKIRLPDIALDLNLAGRNLGTQRDPAAGWGTLDVNGALGNDRASFITDLHLDLAPLADPNSLSFDLTGRIMEIDPRLMEGLYESIGIRSTPFGLDPRLHCRDNRFADSSIELTLKDIRLDDRLAKKMGGMGSIDSLRFPVPVRGTLQEPSVDVKEALIRSLGGNTKSLLNAFLKGTAAREMGIDESPENLEEGLRKLGNRWFGN